MDIFNNKVGFEELHNDAVTLINETFFKHNDESPSVTKPAFYLGGFNASTKEEEKVIQSKCFTGIISNLEVITTQESPISTQMLEFIIENQIIDSSWSQYNERAKEEDSPPAVKKKKVT